MDIINNKKEKVNIINNNFQYLYFYIILIKLYIKYTYIKNFDI